MSIARTTGILLLIASAISLGFMTHWFIKSNEFRAKQSELHQSVEQFESGKNSLNGGVFGAGMKGLGTIGLLASEAGVLGCEKKAWQFCSLSLLLGFSGAFLILMNRKPSPALADTSG